MPLLDVDAFSAALPYGAPVLGLDLGSKTIGVAVSDVTRSVASPLSLIAKTKFTEDAATLVQLMASRSAKGLVIGMPYNMDGTEGARCQSNRAFVRNLARLDPASWESVPMLFWDERLSTAAVDRMLIQEHDVNRARRAELVDKVAAAWILQGALERLRMV